MINADPIFITAEIREIERMAATLPDSPQLMEKAGLAAAQIVRDHLLKDAYNNVLVLAGPGNNGGDAFVAARYLKQWGNRVIVVFSGDRSRIPPDAKHALQAWLAINGEIAPDIPSDQSWSTVIDGLFGIGLNQRKNRPIEGKYLEWIHRVNQLNVPIVALDIPSGLGSDDGCVHGAAIRATMTVTFIEFKPGLFTNFGPEYCGTLLLCDLDIPLPSSLQPKIWRLDRKLAQSILPPRRSANCHKGTFGTLAILGGSTGMVGAALLAGRSALHLGAGRIYLGLLTHIPLSVDFVQPELMLRSPSELFKLKSLDCLVVGPGLGNEPEALSWLDCALDTEIQLVLDADALNLIAMHSDLAEKLNHRTVPVILTPHPAEAARLLKTDTTAIQNNRMEAAHKISQQFNAHVVLKGAGSICCFSDGRRYLNTSGNPALSTAGTGDVLTGMIGALIAQGSNPEDALLLAVYLHGAAADQLRQQYHGPVGITASEIVTSARLLLNQWIY
jgi:hydroxyethylthiazole kinase-like uncharacterized protein yjeF